MNRPNHLCHPALKPKPLSSKKAKETPEAPWKAVMDSFLRGLEEDPPELCCPILLSLMVVWAQKRFMDFPIRRPILLPSRLSLN